MSVFIVIVYILYSVILPNKVSEYFVSKVADIFREDKDCFEKRLHDSLVNNKDDWRIGKYTADHKNGLELWVANRYFADMTIDDLRINWLWRHKIRKACDDLRGYKNSKSLG
jgi:hypothetical protein